jgi:hypothetical protein
MPRAKLNAVQLTQKELKALVAGRSDEQIGAAVRKMLLPRGRRKELDLDVLVKMRMAGCRIPEIAAEMNVSEKTVDNRLRDDMLFRNASDRGEERGKAAIRMAQFRKAVVDKDTGMLIWQGKNRLGQKDRSEIGGITDSEGKPAGVAINIVVSQDEANL